MCKRIFYLKQDCRIYRLIIKKDLYSPFHKTLPRSSYKLNLISVRFYEMGDTCSQSKFHF